MIELLLNAKPNKANAVEEIPLLLAFNVTSWIQILKDAMKQQ